MTRSQSGAEHFAAHQAALKFEMDFIDAAETLQPLRYFNIRQSLKESLLRSRLSYLSEMRSEIGL